MRGWVWVTQKARFLWNYDNTKTLVTTHRFCGGTCSPPLAPLHHRKTSSHHRKRARLLIFDGASGCSFAASTTLSLSKTSTFARFWRSRLLLCHLHHPFTRTTATRSRQHLRDGGRRHGDDICRRSQRRRRVTTHQHHLLPSPQVEQATKRWVLFVAPLFNFFLTQQGGTTSLLTLCSRNRACVLDFEVLFSTTTTNRPCRLHVNTYYYIIYYININMKLLNMVGVQKKLPGHACLRSTNPLHVLPLCETR